MHTTQWVRGPLGVGALDWLTRTGCASVLVAVPTMTAGTRLLDLLPVFDGDHRVQLVLTIPTADDTWHGLDAFARRTGGLVMPWEQAARLEWDAVLAASTDCIAQMHGNMLLLPHGAGLGKSRKRSRTAGARPTTGVDREFLTRRGRVIPAAIAVPTEVERELLRERCPEAHSRAFVAGDLCLDRLRASLPLRQAYRRALGLDDSDDLVTISSTWSAESTFGSLPELYERAVRELSPARVAAVLHPNVWAVHGALQVRAWLARAIDAGLLVIPPDRGWQATVVASDVVIGDHGSTTMYAAALGLRMCLAAFPAGNIREGSVADLVGAALPRLDPDAPLRPQVAAAARCSAAVAEAVTSRPGRAHRLVRRAVYGLLGLPEPGWPAPTPPAQLPRPVEW